MDSRVDRRHEIDSPTLLLAAIIIHELVHLHIYTDILIFVRILCTPYEKSGD